MRLTYVFVHGLSGWGRYDPVYARMPYWGMRGGDLMAYLRERGFECYAASVDPKGSAWDRACELYAQIAGTRVDYGESHSARFHHPCFGRDFTEDPLIPEWGGGTRLVLFGHSFGGVTVRLLAEFLANGDADERRMTPPETLSPLFRGGMADRIHSVVTLAAPTNGTTAYDLFSDGGFDAEAVEVPWWSRILSWMMSLGTDTERGDHDPRDRAGFDMHVDNAAAINERISTLPGTYYFAVPCSATEARADGTHVPKRGIEPLFVQRSYQIGTFSGTSAGGMELDASWRENDGLVNTVSATAPFNAPSKPLDRSAIEKGVWNVFPTLDGDHMWLQGGLMRTHDIRAFYTDLLGMIGSLD